MSGLPERLIAAHLEQLLNHSEAGATMHYLHVVSAPRGVVGPFGVPDEEQLKTSIYAIAPTREAGGSVEDFITKVIVTADAEAASAKLDPLFAALSQEVWTVRLPDEQVPRMAREGRLHEHPDAVEATVVYGACRDGRRWRGRRWLTGPQAGTSEAADLLVGRAHPDEAQGVAVAPLVRRLVRCRA